MNFFAPQPLSLALGLLIAFGSTACRSSDGSSTEADPGDVTSTWDPPRYEKTRGVSEADLSSAIAERLNQERPASLDVRDWRRVQALYANYDTVALWLEEDADSERADALIAVLLTIHEHGLRGDRFPLAELRDALEPIDKARRPTAAQLAAADVMLSATYVALGEDLLIGQIEPGSVEQQWHIDHKAIDVDSALARTLRLEPLRNAIARLRPPDEQYDALQRSLRHYRDLVQQGGWKAIPDGESLERGDTASLERITALALRLEAEEYLPGNSASSIRPLQRQVDSAGAAQDSPPQAVYDERLAGAVAAFQARHAIVVDSVVGPETLRALNTPAEYRAGQIMANLERFRWLPRELGDRYVYVNVPAFRLDAYDNGAHVLDMRVIVGSEYEDRATPAFADSMSYIEFAPYWTVPQEIAEKEIWPKVEADPDYLERNEYEVVEIGGREWLRQRPGAKNALGQVKFMFPNTHNIYLHDTPEDQLFERDVRALSHGCVRVGKPAELAAYALAHNDGWDAERIRSAMNGTNRQVPLERKIPVYIVYFTTFVRDDVLHFGNDIYDRDSELVRLVSKSALPTPDAVALLEELRELVD